MTHQRIQPFLTCVLLFGGWALGTPPPGHVPVPSNDLHPPKYEYGYVVSDQGGSQGHMESRDGIYALGRYHVSLPDGSGQKVSYFADDWGYHPLVSYVSSTEHGTSHTEFAMGDKAVAALKQTGSPVANLISSPSHPSHVGTIASQTPPIATEAQVAVHVTNAAAVSTAAPAAQAEVRVQVYNDGASGHNDQNSHIADVSSTTTTVLPPTSLFTVTTTPPPVTASSALHVLHQESHSTPTFSTSIPVESVSVTASPAPVTVPEAIIQSQIQQQQEAQIIQLELQNKIQQTINKLEQSVQQQVNHDNLAIIDHNNLKVFQQSAPFDIQSIHQGQSQQEIQEDISNRIQQNREEQINVLQRQQIEQQQLQNQIRLSAQQGIQQQGESGQIQSLSQGVSVAPAVHYVSNNVEQVVAVHPEYNHYHHSHSPLANVLLQESHNTISSNRVEIVTPTPTLYNKEYQTFPILSGNSITANDTTPNSVITIDGQNVQITSYLADTNRVLQFGDRIRARERQQDQRLIDEIERHAKQRIYHDLRKPSSSFIKPIVAGPQSSPARLDLFNTAQYNKVSTVIPPSDAIPHGTPSPSLLPPINHGHLESNSLSHAVYENADLSQTHAGVIGNAAAAGHHSQSYVSHEQLAPLQAGLTLLSTPEKNVPVNEESNEDVNYNTVINVQNGPPSSAPGQYQALGYERRLVDTRAQQVINEPNPTAQAQKTVTLARQQENELRQLQANVMKLQQKIVDEIDAQHEEEQRKQEVVNNERQQHLESLQKVEDLIKTSQVNSTFQGFHGTSASDFESYQGPQYLPPLEATAPSYHQYPASATVDSHQEVAFSSFGQDLQSSPLNSIPPELQLAPPPQPPQYIEIEKPVIVEKPIAVETTKVVEIERPVVVKETVPIERTKFIEVEKTVPILQPYPVPITRLVTFDRPVAVPTPYGVPQPIPIPYAVPQLVPYPDLVPIPFKQYHPVYIHTKNNGHEMVPSKRLPDQIFKEARPELFHHSHSYHTIPYPVKSQAFKPAAYKTTYHRRHYGKPYESYARNKNYLKNLRIEYGGFKPPLVPSTEFSEEPQPSPYGPSIKE